MHPDKPALADVAYVVASTYPPASRSALLSPSTHAASIAALVNAFNSVIYGDSRQATNLPRLSISFQMKQPGADSVFLHSDGADGGLLMAWNGGLFAIESPAVSKALADLEPLLQPLPKPGTRLWAVDRAGSKPTSSLGKVVLESRAHYIATWRPDSKAVVSHDYALVQILGLDGSESDVAVPAWSAPIGFLADGRLLVGRTVYPGQQ